MIAEAEISSPVAGDELELRKAMALCTDATYEKGESTVIPLKLLWLYWEINMVLKVRTSGPT